MRRSPLRTSRATTPLVLAAAAFTLANGWIHWREWVDTYRDLPSGLPGAWTVRIGFPVLTGLCLAVAALLGVALRRPSLLRPAAAATGLLAAGSLATLLVSRYGSLFGWREPVWSPGAEQTLAVEIGALVCVAAVAVLDVATDGRRARPAATSDAPRDRRNEPLAA